MSSISLAESRDVGGASTLGVRRRRLAGREGVAAVVEAVARRLLGLLLVARRVLLALLGLALLLVGLGLQLRRVVGVPGVLRLLELDEQA